MTSNPSNVPNQAEHGTNASAPPVVTSAYGEGAAASIASPITQGEIDGLHSRIALARETASEALQLAAQVIERNGCTCYEDSLMRLRSKVSRVESDDPWENGALGMDLRYAAPSGITKEELQAAIDTAADARSADETSHRCALPVITTQILADYGQEGFFEKTDKPTRGVPGVNWSQAAVDFACLIHQPTADETDADIGHIARPYGHLNLNLIRKHLPTCSDADAHPCRVLLAEVERLRGDKRCR